MKSYVFISSEMNLHQYFLSQAFYRVTNGSYRYIELPGKVSVHKLIDWNTVPKPDYILRAEPDTSEYEECQRLVNEADVVVTIGSIAGLKLCASRFRQGKLTFDYSERLFKRGQSIFWRAAYFAKYGLRLLFRQKNAHLLCASAYSAGDYASIGLFRNRSYKWGYFPETRHYADLNALFAQKDAHTIVWVGRLIDWKHPELPVLVGERLKQQGRTVRIQMIGKGEMDASLREMITEKGLEDTVCLVGPLPADETRRRMERSAIQLFTSDENEGWGAVLNECMNSGCAVVANDEIGSAPFLIRDKENGILIHKNDLDQMTEEVCGLLDHPEKCRSLGEAAYQTIRDEWSAAAAASRLVSLAAALQAGETTTPFSTGPCSTAENLNTKKKLQ